MNNINPFLGAGQTLALEQGLPLKGKLGYFVSSVFTIYDPDDPSRLLVRAENRFMSLPYKGRVTPPDDLSPKAARNIEVLLGYDLINEYSILGLEPSQAKANLQRNPGLYGKGITLTAGTGIIIDMSDPLNWIISVDPALAGTHRWEPLVYDEDIVFFDGDIVMVYVPI